jgi:hydroxyethylthiazole kinase-like uncharacterized protein yjeF
MNTARNSTGEEQPLVLSRAQVRSIDQLAVARYGMVGLVLMENAGRSASASIDAAYGPAGYAAIVCGTGNNGGDGCVIARHLHNRGWRVRLLMTGPEDRFSDDTRANFRILTAMDLPVAIAPKAAEQEAWLAHVDPNCVFVDALLGTGFSGEVREPTATLIHQLNDHDKRAMVAVDVPSGLDCDTGEPSAATIRADLTVTFVARKRGFEVAAAGHYSGRVEVADIGVPKELVWAVAADDA